MGRVSAAQWFRAARQIQSLSWPSLILAVALVLSACGTAPIEESLPSPAGSAVGPVGQLPATPAAPVVWTSPALAFLDQGVTVRTAEVRGFFHASGGSSISPDGKYILGNFANAGRQSVVAYPLGPGSSPMEFYTRSVPQSGDSVLLALGWTSAQDCVFVTDRIQDPDGDESLETLGMGVYVGSILEDGGSSKMVSFIPGASYCAAWLFPERSEVYLHVRTVLNEGRSDVQVYRAFWRVDLRSGEARLIKDRLPTYDGLFRATLAPGGKYFVYELHESGRSGIFILDSTTCEERALLPDGATKSYLSAISPDGRFLAVYVAGLVTNESGQPIGYDVYPDVDGVWPAAHILRVVDMTGREVASVDMADKAITDVQWSADSRTLSFQVGAMKEVETYFYDFTAESIWMLNWPVAGAEYPLAAVQVAAIPDEERSSRRVEQHPTVDGAGVVWLTDEGDLRLSAPGVSTVTVLQDTHARANDGLWRVPPDVLGGFAVDWLGEPGQGLNELWLLGSSDCRRFACYGGTGQLQAEIAGFGKGTVVVSRRPDPAQENCCLDVFNFAPEYLDQRAWDAKTPWEKVKNWEIARTRRSPRLRPA